jgi:hypothetical protein
MTGVLEAEDRTSPAAAVEPQHAERRADWWCIAFLVVVPLLVFAVPAMLGHPAIAGDNEIQNFPLRALSGRMLREGHLPLWNQYIWSGNPLLGGLNAGSLYPGTLVFAVLPPVAAWVVNLLLVYWAAGLGMYALARHYRLAPLAAVLGASTFAYAGFMSGQLVHLPIVQGVAWLPLMVLAQLRLAWAVMGVGPARNADDPAGDDGRPRSAWPWVLLLAAVFGLVLLTGEPRGMAEAGVVSVVVFLWLLLRPSHGVTTAGARLRYTLFTVAAGVWGVALGAVQLLPGLRFISASQRAVVSYQFFGTGSLRPSWSMLMLVPDLFGGDGLFHQPTFFNNYNLPEVTGYVGLLPLVAAFALLTLSVGRKRDVRAGDWAPWLFFVVLGLFLSWGSFTPLGGLFGHIPFYDRLRLQSRNLAVVDLGLAVLMAFWADRLLRGRTERETTGWRRWVTIAPLLAAAGVCVTALAIPYRFEFSQGTTAFGASLGAQLRGWITAQLVVVAAVVALVLGWRRIPARWRGVALTVVLAADLLLFSIATSTGLTAGNATVEPSRATAAAVLGTQGRFAIYDTTALNTDVLSEIGQPDLNAFTRLPSVQGYGSIVDNTYGTATGTHTLDNLDPCALARGAFTPLRLGSLITLGQFLTLRVPPAAPGTPGTSRLPNCPGAPAAGAGGRRTFYFGQPLTVQSVQLIRQGTATAAPDMAVIDVAGTVRHPALTASATSWGWLVRLATPMPAAGLVVTGPAEQVSPTSTVTTADGSAYSMGGILQDALGQPGWRFSGFWQQYAVFRHPVLPSAVWVSHPAPGTTVRQVQHTDWGTAVVRVEATQPATVVLSQTFQPGWHGQLDSTAGDVHLTVPVQRDGLVQSVRVPKGSWQLTILYRPRGLNTGLVFSAVGLAGVLAVGVVAVVRRRRRRSATAAR